MFLATWSVVTVICSTVEEVSETLEARESMFRATFSTDVIIWVTELEVSCTLADRASAFLATLWIDAAISSIDVSVSSAAWDVVEILRDAGYAGPISVEVEFQGEPWPPLADVTAAMRRSYEHLSSLGLS